MKNITVILACLLTICFSVAFAHASDEKWPGVDETVVGKYAAEHGRPACSNIINIEGDALLFAFLVAGAVGGFTLGYYYRDFAAKKRSGGEADAG